MLSIQNSPEKVDMGIGKPFFPLVQFHNCLCILNGVGQGCQLSISLKTASGLYLTSGGQSGYDQLNVTHVGAHVVAQALCQ